MDHFEWAEYKISSYNAPTMDIFYAEIDDIRLFFDKRYQHMVDHLKTNFSDIDINDICESYERCN